MSSTSSELNIKILRAGAGAGKTTTLTKTFLEFASKYYEEHGHFPRIVVTTFTRKATQELKERLLKKALEDKREDLFQYVSAKSQVQISTIHGVLSIFIGRYGSEIGLTPDFRIISDIENKKLIKTTMKKYLLENADAQELLEDYDFAMLEEALHFYYQKKVHFPNLNFVDRKAFEEKTFEQLRLNLGGIKRLCIEIKSQCENEKWNTYLDLWSQFKDKEENEGWDDFYERFLPLLSNRKPNFSADKPVFSGVLHEEFASYRNALKALAEKPRFRPAFWDRHQKVCEIFERFAQYFHAQFLKLKIDTGILSMADLETISEEIISRYPLAAKKFSEDWDYWMIDEYQDTSPVQVKIMKSLIGDRPYFIVGDPQQSIYLFRGARSEVFHEKVIEVEKEGGEVAVELKNYRSHSTVLAFLNDYFTKTSSKFSAMEPAKTLEENPLRDTSLQIIQTENDESSEWDSEITTAIGRVQELIAEGVSLETICILARTHATLENLAKVAQLYGVPVQLHSQSQFYYRREVLDALAILKFLINPHDNANLICLLRSPWFVVPDNELVQYCHAAGNSFWADIIKKSYAEFHPVSLLKKLIEVGELKGFSWALKEALIQTGMFDYAHRLDSSGRREANLWKVVSLIADSERKPGFNFLDFLDSGLQSISLEEGGEDGDATPVIEPKRLNLMTVHASKGLQFDHIILTSMGKDPKKSNADIFCVSEKDGQWTLKIKDDDLNKNTNSILAEEVVSELRSREEEEYFRVLYVALTRAKKGITLIWNKEFSDHSWAAFCPLDTSQGQHQMPKFSYTVRNENIIPASFEKGELKQGTVRSIWSQDLKQNGGNLIAVTELVQSNASSFIGASGVLDIPAGLYRAQQGTEAHRVFEALKYSDYAQIAYGRGSEFQKPLDYILHCQEVPLMKVIQEGYVEWGFALRRNSTTIQGQIDLWGVIDGEVWVIDYKTGSQKFSDVAFAQLEIYAWALFQMNYIQKEQKVHLAVVYPLDEVTKTRDLGNTSHLNQLVEEKLRNLEE